jgi:hypothetical protein
VLPTPHGARPTHGKNFFDILIKVGDFVGFVLVFRRPLYSFSYAAHKAR